MSDSGQRLVIIVIALAVIGIIGWFTLGDQPQTRQYNWYYDLNTGELFKPADFGDQPQAAPSGDMHGAPAGTMAGVAALVVRLDGTRSVLYLQTRNPAITAGAVPGPKDIWVAERPSEPATPPIWFDSGSDGGRRIVEAAQSGLRGKSWDIDWP